MAQTGEAAYFERLGEQQFLATAHVSGAWRTEEQHVAPALGLLAHVVERDRDQRRGDDLVLGRLSWDILGTLPVGEVEAHVEVLRAGRTIELVQARLSSEDRDAVLLRAWLMQPGQTADVAGTALEPVPGPEDTEPWDPTTLWPGGFIDSVQLRRAQVEPGRAVFWVRSDVPLLTGETVGPVAHAARLLDIANGMTVRADPTRVLFPNLDLTAHLVAVPQGEWLGFDTRVTFGVAGIGLTSSVLHDERGPIGTMNQVLTVRPR